MLKQIENGFAYKKFKEMVKNQGGDISYLENTNKFEKAKYVFEVRSKKNGIVKELNAENIGSRSEKISCLFTYYSSNNWNFIYTGS